MKKPVSSQRKRSLKEYFLPLSLRQEVAIAIFVAGAPLAMMIAFREEKLDTPERVLLLGLGAVFAIGVALALAFQILGFIRALEAASRRWRSGDLGFQILPARSWNQEFRLLVAHQNEMARRLDDLYRREKEIADTLQSMLVSPLPRSWGALEFADFYRAGSPSADVGGDFYTLFALPDRRLGLLFGDIGGRGLEAAVKIANLRYALEAYAREEMRPEAIMTRANEIIGESEFQIVTLIYLILDPDTGEGEIANAGHEPPLYRNHAANDWDALFLEGSALGVTASSEFTCRRIRLQPGDLLLLYTDGVASVGPKKGDWSTDDLLDHARSLAAESPLGIVEGIAVNLPLREDDAALVAIRYAGETVSRR